MQKFHIFHETRYDYAAPVALGEHRLLVRPRDGHDVRIESSKLAIEPNATVNWHRDELDNSVAIAHFDDTLTSTLCITSELMVAHYVAPAREINILDSANTLPPAYEARQLERLSNWQDPLRKITDDTFADWLAGIRASTNDTLTLLHTLSERIYNDCEYAMREEPGVQSPGETLRLAKGSCRDYAWLFISAARASGVAARFVSGYLHTSVQHLDSHTHAWAEVYLPGAGWVGYDPTCNAIAADNHIPVAHARYPEDVPPVAGVFRAPADTVSSMEVRVKVTQL